MTLFSRRCTWGGGGATGIRGWIWRNGLGRRRDVIRQARGADHAFGQGSDNRVFCYLGVGVRASAAAGFPGPLCLRRVSHPYHEGKDALVDGAGAQEDGRRARAVRLVPLARRARGGGILRDRPEAAAAGSGRRARAAGPGRASTCGWSAGRCPRSSTAVCAGGLTPPPPSR